MLDPLINPIVLCFFGGDLADPNVACGTFYVWIASFRWVAHGDPGHVSSDPTATSATSRC